MYKRAKQSWMKHIDFILMDLLIVQLSFVLAYATRMAIFGYPIEKWLVYSSKGGRMVSIVMAFLYIMIIFLCNSYSGVLRRGYFVEFKGILRDVIFLVLGELSYLFITQTLKTQSRIIMILHLAYCIVLMFCFRSLLKKWIISTNSNVLNMHHILLVTTREKVGAMLDNFANITYNYHVVGVVLMDYNAEIYERGKNGENFEVINHEQLGKVPIIAITEEGVYEYAVRNVVDEVFIYVPGADNKRVGAAINSFLQMGITVHVNLDMISSGMPNVALEKMGDCMVMTSSVNVMSPIGAALKRMVDILAGIVGCIITGILFLFLGPAIKISDPGPVFFGQERAGKNGRRFKIYKFRSMYMDAEERKKDLMKNNKMDGLMFKMEEDPRIIGSGPDGKRKGLGYWIRTLSLDEFPNFYSILKGDMSLVGTRPPTMDEYSRYSLHHKSRLAVKPGLTGMWQAEGRSDITDFEEIVELDNEYIRNWSFGLDIKIIVKTFIAVLTRKGSM